MSKSEVPDDVRRFVLTSVPSVPYLEALLLLRSERARNWDSFGVASRLYIGEGQAAELLDGLQAAGVASRAADGAFQYAPATSELRQTIEVLADTYAHNLVGVTDLIHSRVDRRAQQLSEGFRWKKDRGG